VCIRSWGSSLARKKKPTFLLVGQVEHYPPNARVGGRSRGAVLLVVALMAGSFLDRSTEAVATPEKKTILIESRTIFFPTIVVKFATLVVSKQNLIKQVEQCGVILKILIEATTHLGVLYDILQEENAASVFVIVVCEVAVLGEISFPYCLHLISIPLPSAVLLGCVGVCRHHHWLPWVVAVWLMYHHTASTRQHHHSPDDETFDFCT
jgi:hypothetical protein